MARLILPALLFVCLYAVASATEEQPKVPNKEELHLQTAARVEQINKSQKRWTAKVHPRFASMTQQEKSHMLGLDLKARVPAGIAQPAAEAEPNRRTTTKRPTTTTTSTTTTTAAPTTTTEGPEEEDFDAREEWPECADVIGLIQDQSACGSCWAVSSASVMQDRICIESEGKLKVNISAEDILSCETRSYGCNGGWPQHAFEFWEKKGVCTGSEYNDKAGCKPYPFPPHGSSMYNTPRCKRRCENRKYKTKYPKDKHFGVEPVSLQDLDEQAIMDAIWEAGPVEANMVVYDDFFHYSSGVYEKSEDAEEAGGHAVRIIGWGTDEESDMPYWLVANSWNTDWGLDGYFKIARGQDECNIETWGINYGNAKVDEAVAKKTQRRRR